MKTDMNQLLRPCTFGWGGMVLSAWICTTESHAFNRFNPIELGFKLTDFFLSLYLSRSQLFREYLMLFPPLCCCRARSLLKMVQDSLCKGYNLGLGIFSQNPQHSGVHRQTWRKKGFCASHYSFYVSRFPVQLEIYAKRKLRLDSKLKTLTTSRHNMFAVALGIWDSTHAS